MYTLFQNPSRFKLAIHVLPSLVFIPLLAGAVSYPVQADEVFPYLPFSTNSVLINNDLNNVHGAITINEAAGYGNQQANLGAISLGNTALSQTSWQPSNNLASSIEQQESNIWIGQSFQNSSGWIAINQAAGASNQQGNAINLSSGATAIAISDTLLAMNSPHETESVVNDGSNASKITIGMDHAAFENTHGVVQINQAGGTGNSSFNHFSLTISDEAK
ncbi:MAG: hypothetical protein KGQ58_06015 [Proteobacteria bacterium]|nr:hypothetical protein [Pseudomonadota bacterium]